MRIVVSREYIAPRARLLLAHTYGINLFRFTFSIIIRAECEASLHAETALSSIAVLGPGVGGRAYSYICSFQCYAAAGPRRWR
jgi:hypothetical protein